MSQQNQYPPYNMPDNYFAPQPPRPSSNTLQPWAPRGSRALSNASTRRLQVQRGGRSAPNSRPGSLVNFNPANIGQQEPRIDPNLHLLSVPQSARPRPSIDPIARFYNDDTAPWTAERIRDPSASLGRSAYSQPNLEFPNYREAPGSEVESNDLRSVSDSGYHSLPPQSMPGIEPEKNNQEVPEMNFQFSNITVNSASSGPTEMYHFGASDHGSQISRSTAHGKEFKCPQCQDISKCRSDHKKHMLKHDKPFKCDVLNCRRDGKGFTTVNDLNRHKKSVHRIGALEGSYQCASENCRNREKVWPRLDNFKQHVHRMHPDEDESDLIRRSEYRPQETTTAAQSLSVAPMDTTLAGIGMEKQFSNNDFDHDGPGISLTPDQASNPWNSFVMSSHDFAMDVDQGGANLYASNPGKTNPDANAGYKPSGSTPTGPFPSSAHNWESDNASRNSSLNRLTTLASVASSQASPDKAITQSTPVLSKEPQTKAEQQKQALQKLSKVIAQSIQSSSNGEPGAVESAVWSVLGTAAGLEKRFANSPAQPTYHQSSTQGPSASKGSSESIDTMSRTEVIKGLQALQNLMKQNNKKHVGMNNRPRAFSNNMKSCNICNISLARPCDLKKHMKRHTRPYGCTYPKCHKRFGAKSDWKRHENSQHFQLESYRCQLMSPSTQTPCGELFYRAEIFKNHLQSQHKTTDREQIDHEVKNRRIGRNGQGQFWCGFCREIIRLKEKRNAAWDERFNHIDDHFRNEKRIEEWLCLEAKKTKGEVLKEMDKNFFEDDDDSGEGFSPEELNHPDLQDNGEGSSHIHGPQPPEALAPASSGSNPRKRQASTEPTTSSIPRPKSKKKDKMFYVFYCCQCSVGPWLHDTSDSCMLCHHPQCSSCKQRLMVNDEASAAMEVAQGNA